jgi:aryl-alcohol dehydrogenase-like predicted oxidoreductase
MQYSALGNPGLMVSRLSFGASALGRVLRAVDEFVAHRSSLVAWHPSSKQAEESSTLSPKN